MDDNPYAKWATPQAAAPSPTPVGAFPQTQSDNPYARWVGGNGMQPASDTGTDTSEPSWSELPGNIPSSAYEAAHGLYQTVAHPIDTATGFYNAGFSGIKDYFVQRYGSAENAKRTFIKDPVGALMDLSTFLTGPEGAAIKLAGSASKIGRVAAKAGAIGRAIDPIAATAKATSKVAEGAGKGTAAALGITTGAGSDIPITKAAEAGFVGGDAAKAFKSNLKSLKNPAAASPEDVVNQAREAMGNAGKDLRSYFHGEINAMKDKPVPRPLGAIADIRKAIDDASGKMGYAPPGMAPLTLSKTEPVVEAMHAMVNKFAKEPYEYKTIGGFDLLKRNLNALRKKTPFDSEERNIANKAYYAVRDVITNVHPAYADLMGEYRAGKGIINDIVKTFSLGPNSTVDTALRKLQSTMRNNVFANLGARVKAIEFMKQHGADNIAHALAGQSLRPMMRSNLAIQMAGPTLGIGSVTGVFSPAAITALAAFSPRLMGHAAYTAGKVAGTIVHPLLAAERAMRRIGIKAKPLSGAASAVYKAGSKAGITKRGLAQGAAQVGKIANQEGNATQLQNNERFKSALATQAKAMGYNLSPRVIETLSQQLLSEDPQIYIKGVTAIGHSKRLLDLITKVGEGTKGKQ